MHWINVKDRLPTNEERVGYTYDGKHIRYDAIYDIQSKTWLREVCRWEEEVNVTHWMSYPAKPDNE